MPDESNTRPRGFQAVPNDTWNEGIEAMAVVPAAFRRLDVRWYRFTGRRLPSVRQLAERWGVPKSTAHDTVKAATAELEAGQRRTAPDTRGRSKADNRGRSGQRRTRSDATSRRKKKHNDPPCSPPRGDGQRGEVVSLHERRAAHALSELRRLQESDPAFDPVAYARDRGPAWVEAAEVFLLSSGIGS